MLHHLLRKYRLLAFHGGKRPYGSISASGKKDRQVDWFLDGLRTGDRAALAEAITLVESTNPEKQKKAQQLLTLILEAEKQKVAKEGPKALSFRIGRRDIALNKGLSYIMPQFRAFRRFRLSSSI